VDSLRDRRSAVARARSLQENGLGHTAHGLVADSGERCPSRGSATQASLVTCFDDQACAGGADRGQALEVAKVHAVGIGLALACEADRHAAREVGGGCASESRAEQEADEGGQEGVACLGSHIHSTNGVGLGCGSGAKNRTSRWGDWPGCLHLEGGAPFRSIQVRILEWRTPHACRSSAARGFSLEGTIPLRRTKHTRPPRPASSELTFPFRHHAHYLVPPSVDRLDNFIPSNSAHLVATPSFAGTDVSKPTPSALRRPTQRRSSRQFHSEQLSTLGRHA